MAKYRVTDSHEMQIINNTNSHICTSSNRGHYSLSDMSREHSSVDSASLSCSSSESESLNTLCFGIFCNKT